MDPAFMQRALALAAPGVGRTGENPSVGCVIVRDGMIVGEGATALGGRPHAEHVALARAGDEAVGADVYVTLEPCASRSVPGTACTDLLIAARVARVIIGARDPHPHAQGAGLERLRAAGIGLEFGVLDAEARAQNADFFAKWD
jgi:diaminohydroxyphosphoribosylaminopyrimidine deaminase/5-amino-6-(5-phosphoribosylamino)uracil reductase